MSGGVSSAASARLAAIPARHGAGTDYRVGGYTFTPLPQFRYLRLKIRDGRVMGVPSGFGTHASDARVGARLSTFSEINVMRYLFLLYSLIYLW